MFKRSAEKMHRIDGGQNDWDGLEDHELSRLQKIAKKTKGLATLANTVSIGGFILVTNGLVDFANGQKAAGTTKVVGGRLCDLVDGFIADKTETKGKTGEAVDAGLDGLELFMGLGILENAGAIPLVPALVVAGPKVVDTVATVAAKLRHREIHATDEAKLGAAAIWGGLGAIMLKGALDKHVPGFVDVSLEVAGWGGIAAGTINKLPGTVEYLHAGFGSEVAEQIQVGE